MKEYLTKNYKVFLSIFFSLLIVLFIIPIVATPGRLKNIISKIKFNFSLINTGQTRLTSTKNTRNNYFNLTPIPQTRLDDPTPTENKPTKTPTITRLDDPTPTVKIPLKIPTKILSRIPTKRPTIKPTKVAKPTHPPNEFPIDPSLVRPGKTTDDVFAIAAQKTCVPAEILKSIAYIESGEFFSVVDPKYFLLYNSYNWWNSPYLTEEKRACGGYDYDNGSGIVEPDSKFAGHNCHSDGTSGAQSYILGPMQVSGYEQTKWGPQAAKLLGISKIDRRVILDAITIVGVITKINVQPTSCTNWSGHDIVKAACGYYGSCGIADGTYYCATFCRNYKRFGGKGSCDATSFGNNCWN